MRYFVAYIIGGEAGTYHEKLTKTLAERFDVVPLHDRVPPHITFKAPFDAGDISGVQKALHEFSDEHAPVSFLLRGFDCFGTRVVYLDVDAPEQMRHAARDLLTHLGKEIDAPAWKQEVPHTFHASVARFLKPDQYEQVWAYIQDLEEPSFELDFDHVALLKYHDQRWVVDTIYPLS